MSEGDEIEFAVQENGTITLRGYISVPSDQAWSPPPDRLTGRRRADRETRKGTMHATTGAMFAYLDALGALH